MEILATKLVNQSIEKTKALLLPFNWKIWLKLAILTMFVGSVGSSNYNSRGLDRANAEILDLLAQYWEVILAVFIVLFMLGVLYAFFRSVLQFCFLDSIATKNVQILGYFKKNLKKGASLFMLDLVVNAGILIIAILLFYDTIRTAILNIDNLSFDMFSAGYIISGVILIMILAVVSRVMIWMFTIYYMHTANETAVRSLINVTKLCIKNLKETLFFILINMGLGIALGIAAGLAILALILALMIIGALIFGIGFLFYKIAAVLFIPLVVIGAIFGIAWIIALILGCLMIVMPMTVFTSYYRMDFIKGLMKVKTSKANVRNETFVK